MPWIGRLKLLAGLVSILAATASAQLPQARLASVFPPGARAGSTNLVTVAGADLDEPSGLLFSDPRIMGTPKAATPNQFQVTVPAEVPPGLVDVRFAGRFGVSNPRAFAVGGLPELTAPATNTSPAEAFPLPFDTVANGRVQPSQAHWFRLSARAGQRVLVRIQARELDSRLVPDLTITDAAGRERAIARRRELLDFTAPADGDFLLKLHDQTYRGGEEYACRLTVSSGPQVDFAVPLAVRSGGTNRVTLFGRNLPGGRATRLAGADGGMLEQLTVTVAAPRKPPAELPAELLRRPAGAALAGDLWPWRLVTSNGVAGPLPFSLTTSAVFVATTVKRPNEEKADRLPRLVKVSPPCEFTGLFPARGEVSGVTFAARKGDVLWIELFAERLGFPCDAHAVVQQHVKDSEFTDLVEIGDTEANPGDREFNTASTDAAVRFEAPEDARYQILVRDRFNSAAGRPRYPYRLSLRPASPDFRLVALPQPPPPLNNDDRSIHVTSISLRRGQTLPVKVMAFRRDGFNAEIKLTVSELPRGVTAAATPIAAGQATGTVLLTAGEQETALPTNAFRLAIAGSAGIGGRPVTRPALAASVIWPVPDFNNEHAATRLVREPLVSVIAAEPAPVTVSPAGTNTFEPTADCRLVIPLWILRRGGFSAAFKLKPAGHPALDQAAEADVAENATNANAGLNLAEAKLPVGAHTLWLQGTVAGQYRNQPEAVALAEAELQRIGQALASASEADRPKIEARKQAAEAARKAAEERATPRDVTFAVYSRPFVVRVTSPPKP